MPDPTPRVYEALFLVSQAAVSTGLGETLDFVRDLITRHDGEIVALRKWDDRKLAYAIQGQKRGTFLIAHFRIKPTQIVQIERDCNLSDEVLRVMFTRCDHFGETELEAVVKEGENVGVQEELETADA